MKKTKLREDIARLKRVATRCQMCGKAPAVRFNKLGMAVCGKAHSRKDRRERDRAV